MSSLSFSVDRLDSNLCNLVKGSSTISDTLGILCFLFFLQITMYPRIFNFSVYFLLVQRIRSFGDYAQALCGNSVVQRLTSVYGISVTYQAMFKYYIL